MQLLRPLADQQEREVVALQHVVMNILPGVIVHDGPWLASAARYIALELWRVNIRAA